MSDEERLNPGHSQLRGVLRVVGPLVALTGLVFLAIGMISFFSSFGSMSGSPKYFWCAFVGIPLLGVGGAITKFAYMGAFFRYMAGETAPVAKDTVNYMASGTKDAVRTVAGAVREGLTGESGSPAVRCSQCGTENDAAARFCDECGAQMPANVACPSCGAKHEPGAKFCSDCGHSLA